LFQFLVVGNKSTKIGQLSGLKS